MSSSSLSPEEKIQQAAQASAAVQELRAGFDDVTELRNVFQMDAKGAATNFTITQLATQQCFAAPPLTLVSVKARTVVAVHYIGPGMAGHPGIVHGGVISTILDECSGKAGAAHFEALYNEAAAAAANGSNGSSNGGSDEASFDPRKGVLAVTAQLTIEFKNATRADAVVVTRATVDADKSSSRKAIVTAQMWQAGADSPDKSEVVATGNGLFIRPRANV